MIRTLLLVCAIALSGGSGVSTTAQALRGLATWYDAPSTHDAAAGPALRKALGKDWRNRWVTVSANGHSVLAFTSDWCACSDRHGQPTLIDLDRDNFAILADPSRGVVDVTIEWEDGPAPTLPPTDIEEGS